MKREAGIGKGVEGVYLVSWKLFEKVGK